MAQYRRLALALSEAVNGWLPDEYAFGLSIPHDVPYAEDDPRTETEPEDLAQVDRNSEIRLREYRQEALRHAQRNPGKVADEDVAGLPTAGRYIIAEIVHWPTGAVAFRAYAYDAIRDLMLDPNRTAAQKRAVIRNQLTALYTTAQERAAVPPVIA